MTHTDATLDDTLRQQIVDAALDQLAVTGLAAFTLEGVAVRAGVHQHLIKQIWPNTEYLFAAMFEQFSARYIPVPDTGTFRGDLLEYARSCAAVVNTPSGRRMFDAVIVKPQDWDLAGARESFMAVRASRVGVIVARAVARGECPAGTDPILPIDLLAMGLSLPVLIYDRPLTDEHCIYVVDTLLNGITAKR